MSTLPQITVAESQYPLWAVELACMINNQYEIGMSDHELRALAKKIAGRARRGLQKPTV